MRAAGGSGCFPPPAGGQVGQLVGVRRGWQRARMPPSAPACVMWDLWLSYWAGCTAGRCCGMVAPGCWRSCSRM